MDLRKIYPHLCPVKKWYVRSKSDPKKLYLVEKMADGSFRCNCWAGFYKRDCSHKKMIKEYDKKEKAT